MRLTARSSAGGGWAGLPVTSCPATVFVCACVCVLRVRCCVFGCECRGAKRNGASKDKKERGGENIEQLRASQPADDHAMLILPWVGVMLLLKRTGWELCYS